MIRVKNIDKQIANDRLANVLTGTVGKCSYNVPRQVYKRNNHILFHCFNMSFKEIPDFDNKLTIT